MSKSTIEPLTLMCLDGEERGFLLTHRVLRELGKDGISTSTALVEFVSLGLHKSLVGPSMTEEELDVVLPPDPEMLLNFWNELRKHCSPKANEKYRPTTASEQSTGLLSSVSGESASASQ